AIGAPASVHQLPVLGSRALRSGAAVVSGETVPKRDAAPGVDGVTWETYEQGLDRRIEDLHTRVQSGAYRAQPSRCRTNATTCSRSPVCSTTNWPRSHKLMKSPNPSCAKRALCTACRAPRPHIGKGGIH